MGSALRRALLVVALFLALAACGLDTDESNADGVLTEDLEARRSFLGNVEDGTRTVSEEVADAYADCLKEVDDDEWRQAIADRWTGLTESSATVGLDRDLGRCEEELGDS